MLKFDLIPRFLPILVLAIGLAACSSEDEPGFTPPDNLRSAINYNNLSDTTAYASFFADTRGTKTVDLTTGNTQLAMINAVNEYIETTIESNKMLDSTVLKNQFANTNNAFTDPALNSSGVNLRAIFASSLPAAEAEKERKTLEAAFAAVATASQSVTATAAAGKAGKLGNYLVDANGIEWPALIQQSINGGVQLDYISNVLLSDKNLALDNSKVVSGKPYTELEHNWDLAYGLLTTNPVYGGQATATSSGESSLGASLWQYNKDDFSKIHLALLKGRAAIVNNDPATLKAQAAVLRPAMEKAVATAAIATLNAWKANPTSDSTRAHAIGEALGFIYSLRYAKANGADTAFSDGLLAALIYTTPNSFWGLTNAKVDAAITAIRTKFNITK